MAIFKWTWDPWRELRTLREDVERTFGRYGRLFGSPGDHTPQVNVYRDDDGVTVTAEVPGVLSRDISIETEGDVLRISAKRSAPEGVRDEDYHRREGSFGEFSRELRLPAGLDAEKIDARLADGVLTVRLPKSEAAKPRRIEVSSGS